MTYPNGWLIRMKQHFKSPREYFDDYKEILEKTRGSEVLYASFGNFDRVEFVPIRDFGDYRDEIVVDNAWFGKQQSVIVYALGEEKGRLFLPDPNVDGAASGRPLVKKDDDGNLLPVGSRFLIHTMVYISEAAKIAAGSAFWQLLGKIRDALLDAVTEYRKLKKEPGELLECEVFGSFNSAEVSILWAVDQFVDALYLLDHLRYMRLELDGKMIPVCVTTCTVVSANPGYTETAADGVRGTAMVHLVCNTSLDPGKPADFCIEKTRGYIEKAIRSAVGEAAESALPVYPCVGEFDYMAEVPFPALRRLFPGCGDSTKGSFSVFEDGAQPHIRRTSTCLFYRDADVLDSLKKKPDRAFWRKLFLIQLGTDVKDAEQYDSTPLDVMRYIGECGETRGDYEEIKGLLERLTLSSGMRETFELLYRDYIETLCMATDHLWVKDYNMQFLAVLRILKAILHEIGVPHGVTATDVRIFKNRFKDVCEIMQQQASHIAESSKLFFEVPNSNVGYTAQFVLVYHAYYGIVKEMLSCIYRQQRENWQRYLVPVINFTNTPVIESKLLDSEFSGVRVEHLVSLSLPYDSWSNPMYYTPFLYHEIFHYVAPYSRKERNATFLAISMSQVCICLLWKSAETFFRPAVEAEAEAKAKAADGIAMYGDAWIDRRTRERTNAAVQLMQETVFAAIQKVRGRLASILFGNVVPTDCDSFVLRDKLDELLDPDRPPERKAHLKKALHELCKIIEKALVPSLTVFKEWKDTQAVEDCRAYCKAISSHKGDSGGVRVYNDAALGDLAVNMYDEAMLVEHSLSEVYPDMAMISGTGMGLIEYLAQFALLQKNCLNKPEILEESESLTLRLGSIIDYLLDGGKLRGKIGGKDNEEEFVRLYHVLLRHIECKEHGNEAYEEDRREALEWFGFFSGLYRDYLVDYGAYRDELWQFIDDFCSHNTLSKPLFDLYHEYWGRLRTCKEADDLSREMFRWNIRLIHMFQRQHPLETLQTLNGKTRAAKPTPARAVAASRPSPKGGVIGMETEFGMGRSEDLLKILRAVIGQLESSHRRIFGELPGPGGIWFRGLKNFQYDILPSAFANYHADATFDGTALSKTPYQLLLHRFEQFKFRADGAPEVYSQPSYHESDYLALMQHYQIHTNMLDWSEDVFAALYFALNNYFEDADKRKTEEGKHRDAAICVLDPAAYNRARRKIVEAVLKELSANSENVTKATRERFKHFRDCVERTITEPREWVPNVSVRINREIFDPYFCGDKMAREFDPPFYPKDGDGGPELDAKYRLHLPVAVYTSRLNPRIRAQSGQFMVFSPFTPPVVNVTPGYKPLDKHSFGYMGLGRIQEEYLAEYPDAEPFLLKLRIPEAIRADLADQLRSWGIKIGNYYPELPNQRFAFEY